MMQSTLKSMGLQTGLALALLITSISAPTTLAQSPSIAQASQNERRAAANRLLNRGIALDGQARYDDAIAAYSEALQIFIALQDRAGAANAINNRGNVYVALSRYDAALQEFDVALTLYRVIQDRSGEATVLVNQGMAYNELSRYDDAIQKFNQALPILRQLNDRDSEATALINRGTSYDAISRYDDAIRAYSEALSLFRSVKNRRGEAKALNNLGAVYFFRSRYDTAIQFYNQALVIFRETQDRNNEASVLMNRGAVYHAIARYEDAIRANNEALAVYRAVKNRNGEARALLNQGLSYNSLSRYEEAKALYDEALLIYRAVKDRHGEARLLMNQGVTYHALARYDEALAVYNQSLLIYRMLKDRNGEAKLLTNRGLAYTGLSRYEEALADYNAALPIYQMLKNRNSQGNVLLNRGITYTGLSRHEEALTTSWDALSIFREVNDREGEARALNNLGDTYFRLQRFPEAEQWLRRAIAQFETIRLDGLSETNKISFLETHALSYRRLQQILIAQQQPQAALTVSEWSRTKALVERLSQQLQPTAAPTQAPDFQHLTQIARAQNATLVEYSTLYRGGKEVTLLIWVIQPNGNLTFRQVEIAAVLPQHCPHIAQLIGNSRNAIGVRGSGSDWLLVDDTTQKNSCAQSDPEANFKTLHKLLIEPIASVLPTDPNQHVIFIPDRTLFLVPFPALKSASGQFLIEQHTIRTAASIQLLGKTRALKSRSNGQGALIVGNPLMPNDPNSAQVKQLTNLPNAEQEASAIAALFNTTALTGKAGTKQVVLQQMATAKVIHLATHGSFDDRNGFKSWLALAPTAQDSGILTAEEVAQLKLNADLVVLSACDTGRGKVTGEGVVGLSRSFIAAGVPSVVVSLWSVPDAPTADLMKAFYQQLQRNPDKAQALRQAMLSMLKTYPNPRDWAAFTLMGEAL